MSTFLYELTCLEVSQGAGLKCICGNRTGTIQCIECNPNELQCPSCTIKGHQFQPFHRIEQWRRGRFHSIQLQDLGYVYHLAHDGTRCPSMLCVGRARQAASPSPDHAESPRPDSPTPDPSASGTAPTPPPEPSAPSAPPEPNNGYSIQVAHVNGFHSITVGYCGCASAPPKFVQLLRARIFPGSLVLPRTAYSIAMLDHFHKLTKEAATTAYDYLKLLCRLTDNNFAHKLKNTVRYIRLGQTRNDCILKHVV